MLMSYLGRLLFRVSAVLLQVPRVSSRVRSVVLADARELLNYIQRRQLSVVCCLHSVLETL